MTNSEFMMAIMGHLKDHAPDQDKYHYWMLKMDDEVSSRILRTPAEDPGQTEMAERLLLVRTACTYPTLPIHVVTQTVSSC